MGVLTGGREHRPHTGLRAARAAIFTAVCVVLSAGTHVLLTSAPVPLPPLLGVAALVFVVAYALAGGTRGFWSIAALLLPLQLAADTVFTTGQQTCYGPAGGPVIGPLRSMGFHLICAGGDFGTPLARLTDRTSTAAPLEYPAAAPWLLLAAHVLVGLSAAAWLWRGDAALNRLLRTAVDEAVSLVLPLWARPTAEEAAERGRPASWFGYRPRSSGVLPLLVHSVVRRGPPRQASLSS